MRYFLILFLFVVACKNADVTSGTVKSEEKSKTIILANQYKVSEESVAKNLKTLASDEMEGRASGTKGANMAADFLKEFLEEQNIKPYFSTHFDTLKNFSPVTYNVVGFIEGNDPKLKNEFVIFGAHYDHIGISKTGVNGDFINNGANDDASGVIAVMEIAKYFVKHKTNKRSILIAFFTAEEEGLLGSAEMAMRLKKQNFNLYSMLNFEMIGTPMKANHDSYVTGFSRGNIAEMINAYAGKKLVGYLPMEFQYQLFMRSDNYPFFLEFNTPCHAVSTFDFTNFDYYHHVKDEFELMDTKHMSSLIQDYLKVAEGMTNSLEKEIVLKAKK